MRLCTRCGHVWDGHVPYTGSEVLADQRASALECTVCRRGEASARTPGRALLTRACMMGSLAELRERIQELNEAGVPA